MPATEFSKSPQQASIFRSIAIQSRTMSALAVRFIMTRYGRENIGFLWLILEPMLLCVGVMALWSILKGGYEHGVQIIAIVFTGYMPLTLLRHLSNSGIFILRSSKNTLIHRNITYYDNLISRFCMEFLATSAAALVIYAVLIIFRFVEPAHDFGMILAGWLLMGCIASAMGCLYAGLSELSEPIEKFMPAFNYLMLPLSGCFFMVNWLPFEAQQLVLYIPLVHAFEAIRAGMFGPSIITHYSLSYGFGCALIIASSGILLINWVRDRV
ncbi:ABC transporter permease [Bosea sp. Leaf344]|uniref:ABC transporter permease n=1 Tax=Bosea sp. Leaf344 TaxID=1736346 RepID=UPI000AE23832|nr:ABC transporter permease [Bosea sp. Leaf344]